MLTTKALVVKLHLSRELLGCDLRRVKVPLGLGAVVEQSR